MEYTEKAQYIIGSISLLANKLSTFGDSWLPDITYRQWFLLILLKHMGSAEKTVNSIALFSGTSRQNVKKMLTALEHKAYVNIAPSTVDGRALNVTLTEKSLAYFAEHGARAEQMTRSLFRDFNLDELNQVCAFLDTFQERLDEMRESS